VAELAANVTIIVTISDAAAVLNATVYHRIAGASSFTALTMNLISGTTANGVWEAVIDTSTLVAGFVAPKTVIENFVRSFDNATSSNQANNPATSFVNLNLTDTTAPAISHSPVVQANPGSSVTIYAFIEDFDGVQVALVWYRDAGGQWASKTMTDPDSDTLYNATFDTGSNDMEYYIQAVDPSANNGYSPSTGSATPFALTVETVTGELVKTAGVARGFNNERDAIKVYITHTTGLVTIDAMNITLTNTNGATAVEEIRVGGITWVFNNPAGVAFNTVINVTNYDVTTSLLQLDIRFNRNVWRQNSPPGAPYWSILTIEFTTTTAVKTVLQWTPDG
jgi:hypothetical protein